MQRLPPLAGEQVSDTSMAPHNRRLTQRHRDGRVLEKPKHMHVCSHMRRLRILQAREDRGAGPREGRGREGRPPPPSWKKRGRGERSTPAGSGSAKAKDKRRVET